MKTPQIEALPGMTVLGFKLNNVPAKPILTSGLLFQCQTLFTASVEVKKTELLAERPRWGITDGKNNYPMHDLCGFVTVYLDRSNGLTRRSKLVKDLIANRLLGFDSYRGSLYLKLSSCEQGIQAKEYAAMRVIEFMREKGFSCSMDSRLD